MNLKIYMQKKIVEAKAWEQLQKLKIKKFDDQVSRQNKGSKYTLMVRF